MKYVAGIVLALTLGILVSLFFLGWMHTNIDSYYYYAIGNYFRTGTYIYVTPYDFVRPFTIYPPLYGLFFTATGWLKHTETLLRLLQFSLLIGTGILLYRVLRLFVSRTSSVIISCAFVLWPMNLIYASSVMTENPSQFFVMLWTYLTILGIKYNRPRPIAVAVFISGFAILLKYNLGVFLLLGSAIFYRYRRLMRRWDWTLLVAGIAVVSIWMAVNFRMTGVFGLYDTKGVQLYNQFVAETGSLPTEDHPSVVRMRSLLPPGTDIRRYYFYLIRDLSKNLDRDWIQVDRVFYDVAMAAIRAYPAAYIWHSVNNYARLHYNNVPHWVNISGTDPTDVDNHPFHFCDALGNLTSCKPIIPTSWFRSVWNGFISAEMILFAEYAKPAFFFVLVPSAVITFLFGSPIQRLLVFIYLFETIPIAFLIQSDSRYLFPFYPHMALIFVSASEILQRKIVIIGNRRIRSEKHKTL